MFCAIGCVNLMLKISVKSNESSLSSCKCRKVRGGQILCKALYITSTACHNMPSEDKSRDRSECAIYRIAYNRQRLAAGKFCRGCKHIRFN